MNALALRAVVATVNLSLCGAFVFAFWPSSTPAMQRSHSARPTLAWAPPAWFPEATRDRLWVLDDLDGDGTVKPGPKVRAGAAIVADLDRGEVLWSRDADTPRSIASLTKMFSSLALVSDEPDLNHTVCISPEQWPSRPGGKSKFSTGDCHTGWEYLGAALVASDNRGAFSLPAVAGEEFYTFVDRMNDVSADLGAVNASFRDPAGLEDENTASARDVLKAVVSVSAHPVLAAVSSAPEWSIDQDGDARYLHTTNRLVERYETLAAKTGYTDTAHYCFATVVRTPEGRTLATVVLGAPTSGSRFVDTEALLDWARDH